MEKDIVKHLNYYYYGMMFLAVAAVTGIYFLMTKGLVLPIDLNSSMGMTIQYIVILDALITIPLGLYLFKRKCTGMATIQDEELQKNAYIRAGKCRIIMVSNTMVLGMVAYYLLGGYQSMLWIAAISAIGWYFTKPLEKKVYLELHATENDQY